MAEDRRGADRYQLAGLQKVRTLDEHGKRGELAASVGDARDVRAKLDAARARTHAARDALAAARSARDALVTTGASASQIALAEQCVSRRRRELEAALGEELRCEAADTTQRGVVDMARARLARARADRELIDRHFERWRTARKQLVERRDD